MAKTIMQWLIMTTLFTTNLAAKPIPKSAEEISEDISMRPWLGTFEGCLIWNPECVRFQGESAPTGYFLDTVDDAATNESRCLQRASEYHAWCGNVMTNRTAAVFLETAAMEVYPPFGCALYQRGCPNVVGTEHEGIFMDDYDDAFMNETRCLQRALDFRVYCHPADSPETVAAYYAPTAKLFTVNLLSDPILVDEDALLQDDEDDNDDDLKAENKIEVDVGALDGHSIVLNSTVRALWSISRRPPAFSATAVPLALFDLAGEYLDCHSPPMPLVDGNDRAKASKYHCNGPEAELAVEALQLFLSVYSENADAHYNLGVAYYTLTELDLAISCFVAALKVQPDHSMSVGALGTILTQQGDFEKAWELLDSRVRPKSLIDDLVDDELSQEELVIPKGVSPSLVMAWARLAPRFGETRKAIDLLEKFIIQFNREVSDGSDSNDDDDDGEDDDDDEASRHLSVEGEEEGKSKKVIISPSLKARLEANLYFRLAQLQSSAGNKLISWKESMHANHLSSRAMRLDSDDGFPKCTGYECKNSITPSLALRQIAALRMAFCRDCVHNDIPTSEKWRTRLTSPRTIPEFENEIRPIFVVGMPRSGTTLIEQMLGNHPQIAVAGEVPSLAVLSPRILLNRSSAKPLAMVDPDLTEQDMDLIGAQFMNSLYAHAKEGIRKNSVNNNNNKLSRGTKYIVSKLPNHFELLGLISKVFPGAPIIHTTRDVRDVILSNYQMNYQSGHHWSYNLTDAANYYAGYRAMMKHWDIVFKPPLPKGLSLPMIEVRYEDVVCGPENIARNLAVFLGVSYEPSMKSPHFSKRVAHTSSNEQVRRPVYTSSVGRWKQFSDENTKQEEEEAEREGEDLELLAQSLGTYPARAVLKRVLRYERKDPLNDENDDELMYELVRELPCLPSSNDDEGGEYDWETSSVGIFSRA